MNAWYKENYEWLEGGFEAFNAGNACRLSWDVYVDIMYIGYLDLGGVA